MTMRNVPRHPAELDDLLETAAATRLGVGAAVVVLGEPGSGKTQLADDLCRATARAGLTVLWTSCESAPDAPRLWPWLQLLRQYLRLRGSRPFPVGLEEGMADVIEMVPALNQVLGGHAVPETVDVEAARFR